VNALDAGVVLVPPFAPAAFGASGPFGRLDRMPVEKSLPDGLPEEEKLV
jgi:hypothetical protein